MNIAMFLIRAIIAIIVFAVVWLLAYASIMSIGNFVLAVRRNRRDKKEQEEIRRKEIFREIMAMPVVVDNSLPSLDGYQQNPFSCRDSNWYNDYQAQMYNKMRNSIEKKESDVQNYSETRGEKVINPTLELTESKDKETE